MPYNSDCACCKKEVSLRAGRKISGISCNRCVDYYHLSCVKIDKAIKNILDNANIFWVCQACIDAVQEFMNDGRENHISASDVTQKTNLQLPPKSTEAWVNVANGSSPRAADTTAKPVATFNRFAPLEQNDQGEDCVQVIGDSMVRGLPVTTNITKKRKLITSCHPGARIERVTAVLETEEVQGPTIVSVGTNDVGSAPLTELKERYKRLLKVIRERRVPSVMVGVLPRCFASPKWRSQALYINRWLSEQCSNLGIHFIDLWDNYAFKSWMYTFDGVHLSYRGKSFLGDVLGELLDAITLKNFR